jgi:hypothetical protein
LDYVDALESVIMIVIYGLLSLKSTQINFRDVLPGTLSLVCSTSVVTTQTLANHAEMSALPGLLGLQVTHYWLAALLAALATRVWPYNAVVYQGPQASG